MLLPFNIAIAFSCSRDSVLRRKTEGEGKTHRRSGEIFSGRGANALGAFAPECETLQKCALRRHGVMAGLGRAEPGHPRLGTAPKEGVDGRQSSTLRVERLDAKTGAQGAPFRAAMTRFLQRKYRLTRPLGPPR
jgi:hypothetical protein